MTARLLGVLRGLFCFALFAAAFATVCETIHRALPLPDIPIVWPKLTHFAARHADYDTIFLGSSRVQYQIIPRIFDELSAAQGLPTKSFNAGVAGMRPPEDAFFLDRLLAQRPAQLRWVFVELAGIRPVIGEDRRGTMRVQYWHDWPRLLMLWRHATQLPSTKKRWTPKRLWKELREPLAEFYPHLELFVRDRINLGQGEMLSRRLLYGPPKPRGPLTGALGSDLAGWIPTGRGEGMTPANEAAFESELAERRVKPASKETGDPVSQAALEEMLVKIEAAGATPVLIIPPTTSKKNFVPRPERAAKTIVLDFSDVTRFPELFEKRHRLDSEHTNTAGSEVLTRLLAKHWAEAVKARP